METATETVTVTANNDETFTFTRSSSVRKEDWNRGNFALLGVLSTDPTKSMGKKQVLAALAGDLVDLVDGNWNLRIAYLEESGVVEASGKKVGKKYWLAA